MKKMMPRDVIMKMLKTINKQKKKVKHAEGKKCVLGHSHTLQLCDCVSAFISNIFFN
jgi:hypothetical protein